MITFTAGGNVPSNTDPSLLSSPSPPYPNNQFKKQIQTSAQHSVTHLSFRLNCLGSFKSEIFIFFVTWFGFTNTSSSPPSPSSPSSSSPSFFSFLALVLGPCFCLSALRSARVSSGWAAAEPPAASSSSEDSSSSDSSSISSESSSEEDCSPRLREGEKQRGQGCQTWRIYPSGIERERSS